MADHRTVYCSSACAEEAARHRGGNGGFTDRSIIRWATCCRCSVTFARRGPRPGSIRACPACRLSERERLRIRNRERRRIIAAGDPVDADAIAERDGWRCGICGGDVDPTLEFPHPWSRSTDHVVPLSKGGAHPEANVQLAHLRCNMLKSDKVA